MNEGMNGAIENQRSGASTVAAWPIHSRQWTTDRVTALSGAAHSYIPVFCVLLSVSHSTLAKQQAR